MYFLYYQAKNHGPYALDQIRSMWASGIITADAVYWVQAESVWKPIAELLATERSERTNAPAPDSVKHQPSAGPQPRPHITNTEPLRYAGFWVRAGAILLDGIICLPLGLLAFWGYSNFRLFSLYYLIPGILFGLFYQVYLVRRFGGTPGKLKMGLRVRRTDGEPVSYSDAFLRHLPALIIGQLGSLAMIAAVSQITDAKYDSLSFMEQATMKAKLVPSWYSPLSIIANIWLVGSVICLLTNRRKQTLHDFLADTVVVRVSPRTGSEEQSERTSSQQSATISPPPSVSAEQSVSSQEDDAQTPEAPPTAPPWKPSFSRRVAAIVAYVVAAVCLIFILAEVFGTGTNSLRNLFGLVASEEAVATHPDYKAAKTAEKAGDNATMLKHAKALVERHPKSGLALRCLGDALDYTGAYEEAVATLRKAIALDANDVVAWNDLAVVQEHMKRPSDADAAFQKALKLAEKEPKPWADFGDFCITQRRWQEAIYATEHAARLLEQPLFDTHHGELDEAGVWLTVGENYRRLCKPALATPALKRGTELYPYDVGAWFSLGEVLSSQENHAAALQAFLKVTALDPKSQSAWSNVEMCYMWIGDKERELDAKNRALAIENDELDGYRKAVAANPKDANALIRIASIQNKRRMFPGAGAGDAKEEIACLEKALAIEPDDDFTLQLLGEAYEDAGRLTDAIAAYEKSVQLDPSGDQSWHLAGAYHRSGRLDDAIAAYQKSLQSNPAGGGWKRLASCYAQKGQLQDSIDAYRQAIAMKPPDDESNHFEWFDLGWAYESAGRTVEAAAAYKDADRFSPGFSAAMKVSMAETQTETRQRAVQLYPQLGVAGSPLNREFVARHNRYKAERPAFFINPEWPMQLAKECVNALGGAVR